MKKTLVRSYRKALACRPSVKRNGRSRSACPAGGLFRLWQL